MDVDEIADQLDSIAEHVADLALECLRDAMDSPMIEDDDKPPVPDPVKIAEERRLTRARRSIEKAAYLLRITPTGGDPGEGGESTGHGS